MKNKNENRDSSPRLPIAQTPILSEADGQYTKKALHRIGEMFAEIRVKNGFTNEQFLNCLQSEYFANACTISRIAKHENKHLVNAGQLIELRRAFGVDLNAIADGDSQLPLEDLSTKELFARQHQISKELERRCEKKVTF